MNSNIENVSNETTIEAWDFTSNPESKIVYLSLQMELLVKMASEFSLSDQKSAQKALSLALLARELGKDVEEARKQITKPYVESKREIDCKVGLLTTQFKKVEQELFDSVGAWIDSVCPGMELICDKGTIYSRSYWDYEVINEDFVPREYLSIDEDLLSQAIHDGVRIIEGLKIIEKTEYKMRLKA